MTTEGEAAGRGAAAHIRQVLNYLPARIALLGLAAALLATCRLTAQSSLEASAFLEGGHVRHVGPLAVLGGGVVMRWGRIEVRGSYGRGGSLTGCMGFCDLRNATFAELGGGVLLSASAPDGWSAGALIARVAERFDTPRPLAAAYLRRPWRFAQTPIGGALEFRLQGIPVREQGTQFGWSLRLNLGLAVASSAARLSLPR